MFKAQVVLHSFLLGGNLNLYMYIFDHRPDFSSFPRWTGAFHGVDIGFVFGAPFKHMRSLVDLFTPKFWEIEKGFSLFVMKLWTLRLCEIRVGEYFSSFALFFPEKKRKQWSALTSRLPFCDRNQVLSSWIHCVVPLFYSNITRVEMGFDKVHFSLGVGVLIGTVLLLSGS